MRDLDETDLEILELLMSDARRPWSDIAEIVDLTPPAVSDRVARLQEMGIIRRFTLDVDRSQLREGVPVLLTVTVHADRFEPVRETLLDAEAVEYAFTTAENDLLCYARVPGGDVPAWLSETLNKESVDDYDVTLLTGAEWTPSIGGTEFALTCAECGNTVTSEGVASRIGGDLYQFCCPSCETSFEEQYDRLEEATS
ncbi:AsnC family transcriptional regulator [Halococcus morrhuae DSM 1307]|jgi:Lrp/AsnC family leucine-responsive transcriptional regulator|uniref:AsnC family transcriptional regulator n=1 Tax=Halococcus dombrowskii TaxID=179637 RepID=A0AAV3SJ37_HALDO|nr:AsnC family transcriptional regulator [Halococcus dombrowskii]UOO97455.1 AsnC family transcriptional regulator [Halococcus dombrowskii]